ncbi:MAG TPA: DNA-directed RNA polymerase subunit beta' [Candidatus Angelobacter sp.]|nr:DNA-directed RNA polymerase subunit beta' [Candidatus Angelobacter sp.]
MFLLTMKINKKFRSITLGIASTESILQESNGEVLKPETINYRTHKPEIGGLFCEKIFGPIKNYECSCGKYKRIRYKGITCERCGVEVSEKKVRRERIGHINLVVPVVHIWFFRSSPNKIGNLLGLPSKKVDMIIYYERFLVINPGIAKRLDGSPVKYLDLLTEEEYLSILENLPLENKYLEDSNTEKFIAKMGAESLKDLLIRLDIDSIYQKLRSKIFQEPESSRKEILKRLQLMEAFIEGKKKGSDPSWMVIEKLVVIPPDLRPIVPLEGGRYATSDLIDLYRRLILRNNRLKRLIEIEAPEVIIRNEKRMLQEAADALFDNSKKVYSMKSEANRPLKSISDSLKGKQGRFRQNLLGKRVDYSARSVIVVGPKLKLHECGLPKEIAAEIYKPFLIRKILERGIVKTVKSAKKVIDQRLLFIWEILENVIKGHPVLLNRAPTLHRLGIQAFQPILLEGRAILLHPLVCAAFNADFDGDQMAVHLPLSPGAILEAQLIMLSSQNILNPSNGDPITVPSQDMILGLYYMTKIAPSDRKLKGNGWTFSSPEEVQIAYYNKIIDLHASIRVKVRNVEKLVETTTGRVLFNKVVPNNVGFVNELLTKKSLRYIIGKILKITDVSTTSKFLDEIKELGFYHSFKGGLSFSLGDIIIPEDKEKIMKKAFSKVDEIQKNYNMGLISNNERYHKVIDVWSNANTFLTEKVIKKMKEDQHGFNNVYMMLDSGARGSTEQIRQISGMRGLMTKPKKSGSKNREIIENPILSNFLGGLSIWEYFISTHGARKGLADTALKTAEAGYMTRKLVDVAQDVIIKEKDCSTLIGLKIYAFKKNEEIIEPLSSRILGRISLNDVSDPKTNILLVTSGEMISEESAIKIEKSGIDSVNVRSPLTCDSKEGICAKCYGCDLSNGDIVKVGESVGVIAAQSIGEPGTQLTLRTFHVGGSALNISEASKIYARGEGVVEFLEIQTVESKKESGAKKLVVISRSSELRILDKNGEVIMSNNIPYGSNLYVNNGDQIKKGTKICSWDPYNEVIISEISGTVVYDCIEPGLTYNVECDEQTGFQEKVISEFSQKNIIPSLKIVGSEELKVYNLPIGAHLQVNNGDKIKQGKILVKVPNTYSKFSDITGGFPRLSEMFEARNPSNSAVISEIDGLVRIGEINKGYREIMILSNTGVVKKYLIKLSKQILVQNNDSVKAGAPLSDGDISVNDILKILGSRAVQKYLVQEIKEVYRLQGVKINDKHFEIIVRQMMRKVEILNSGDTKFIEGSIEYKDDFIEENEKILKMKIVVDSGDSELFKVGQLISYYELQEENKYLILQKKKVLKTRIAIPAIAKPILQGITRASLQKKSFISAASFQETTKVLCEAAVRCKTDHLKGLKENVIVGHKPPTGTGIYDLDF